MNHKRHRPSNRRAGCKMCKPWKVNGYPTERLGGEKFSDHVRRFAVEATVEA
jgi:hypothetical protein